MKKLLLISLLVLGAISGCGGGGSSAPPLAITVSIAAQPSSVQVNGSAQFTASVANSSNPGVTWSLTQGGTSCSPGCGTLSSTTSNPTTYTAPSSIPSNASVTLTATSVADTTKSFSVIFSITRL